MGSDMKTGGLVLQLQYIAGGEKSWGEGVAEMRRLCYTIIRQEMY